MGEPAIREIVDELEPTARAELLRVLTSPTDVRADVIRRFCERPGGADMADLLIYLEEWEWARQAMDRGTRRAQRRPMRGSAEALERFERQTAWPMLALSLVIIPLLVVPPAPPRIDPATPLRDLMICHHGVLMSSAGRGPRRRHRQQERPGGPSRCPSISAR